MSDSKHHSAASKKEEGPSRSSNDNHSRSSSVSRSRSKSRSKSSSRSGSPEYSSRSRSRSRSYSRSRSRSRSRGRGRHSRTRYRRYSRSRSRSRSYSPRPYRRRPFSRSPLSNRKRHQGLREEPEPDRCLGVFGLSLYTTEKDLKPIFEKYGPIENINIVYDHQTGRSRGFGFVYYEYLEDAEVAKERTTGIELDGRQIRVDFSITKRAHTPTPGVYMGKPSQHRDYRNWRDNYRDDHRDDDYYHERSSDRHRRYRSRSR